MINESLNTREGMLQDSEYNIYIYIFLSVIELCTVQLVVLVLYYVAIVHYKY